MMDSVRPNDGFVKVPETRTQVIFCMVILFKQRNTENLCIDVFTYKTVTVPALMQVIMNRLTYYVFGSLYLTATSKGEYTKYWKR